jgi:hypothetical protein
MQFTENITFTAKETVKTFATIYAIKETDGDLHACKQAFPNTK